jgi:hypothetical protein
LTGGLGDLDWFFVGTTSPAIDIITDLEMGEFQN